jgi:hypothetical protein
MSQKRVSKAERRDLARKAGRVVLAIVPLLDGATPEEIANAVEIVEDFVVTFRRALSSIEDAPEDPA